MVSVKVGNKRQGPVSPTKALSGTCSLLPSSPPFLTLLPQNTGEREVQEDAKGGMEKSADSSSTLLTDG